VLARFKAARELRDEAGEPVDLDAVFPMEEENKQLIARLAPLWLEHLGDGWRFFMDDEMGLEKDANPFEVNDPRVIDAIERRKFQGKHANETTAEALREIFTEALTEGWTNDEKAAAIDAYYKEHCLGSTNHRPLTAARTQTAGIINDGRHLAANEVGGLKKGWLHGAPGDPRPAHVAAQEMYLAEPIALNEPFVVNGHACQTPGSTELPVGETANCTCMQVYVAA
jgi:hypothetical protein